MVLKALVFIKHAIEFLYYNLIPPRYFDFKGKRFQKFYHFYNATWIGERKVEIPIFRDILRNEKGKILEIGNVMQHYVRIKHLVVDKYEKYPGVINEDVISFNSKNKYDLIISVSTLEHVGIDEQIRDINKVKIAIKNLMSLLNKDGRLIFSFPIGKSPYLDELANNSKSKNIVSKDIIEVDYGGMFPKSNKKVCFIEMRKS